MFEALHAVIIAVAAVCLILAPLPHENGLALAAGGHLHLSDILAYRFRSADFFATNSNPGLLLVPVRLMGAKAFWCATLLLQILFVAAERRLLRAFFACVLVASAYFSPALLFWTAASAALFAGTRRGMRLFRTGARTSTFAVAALLLLAAAYFAYAGLWLANPVHHLHRQRVLGGKSFRDAAQAGLRQKIPLAESCLAVINPDDLRGVDSLELLALAPLQKMNRVAILDLKVVESNYRLLTLRDEKGAYVFSDAARAFAASEKQFAARAMPAVLSAERVCLVANFEILPNAETPPYSRAREIYDARKKAGRDTRIILLPAG